MHSTTLLVVFASLAFPCAPARAQVVDAHVHVFSRTGTDGLGADELLPVMDRAHVDRAVVLSAGYSKRDQGQVQRENDFVAQQVRLAPRRLIGFCGVHPLDTWALDELDRCVGQLGLRGLKLHVNEQRLDLGSETHQQAIARLFDRAAALGIPILIHVDKGAMQVYSLARQHAKATVIFAHAFSHEFRQLAYIGFEFAHDRRRGWQKKIPPNLYADVSGLIPYYANSPERSSVAWHLRQFGVERLLLGSDYPVYSPEETISALRKYGFSQNEMEQILHRNAERLFRR